MREMWDYESREPFWGKTKDVSEMVPEKSKNIQKNIQSIPKIECEFNAVEIMKLTNAPMREGLVQK